MKKQKGKKFLITIDTEGDNLWEYHMGNMIETRNAEYLKRFQDLCNQYRFKPVYLTNYEMINSKAFIEFVAKEAELENCEVGMHLHAWNSPPQYTLKRKQEGAGLPYLIEYPVDIMEQKIAIMTELIKERMGQYPVSHRAGRWAMNQEYYNALIRQGYKIDCSITPMINWEESKGYSEGSKGVDYRNSPQKPFWVYESNGQGKILEIPVTTYKCCVPNWCQGQGLKSVIGTAYSLVVPKVIWLRPMHNNLKDMMKVIALNEKSDSDYLMFMIHSSELMPGGNPTFRNEEEIESLYNNLYQIFERISINYQGEMLKDYI